jgi:cytochrome c oxidase subunit 3
MATVSHADEHGHHGPPEANRSSRVDARLLGIYFFIASEIMLFGSFFTAYFFARVVANKGSWPPPPYEDARPAYVALLNTLILVTSSFTMHWALQSVKRNRRAGLIGGLLLTFLLGLTFLLIQAREYTRLGFSPRDLAFGSTFYGLTGLHGMHVFVGLNLLLYALVRAVRGHYSAEPEKHLGVEIPGIYWHFVDVMWIVVYTTVYIL